MPLAPRMHNRHRCQRFGWRDRLNNKKPNQGSPTVAGKMRSKYVVGVACAHLFLSACGGGGGGGGSTPTPTPRPAPGEFTLSANSAASTAVENGALPSATTVALTITGSNVAVVGAAYTIGQTQP